MDDFLKGALVGSFFASMNNPHWDDEDEEDDFLPAERRPARRRYYLNVLKKRPKEYLIVLAGWRMEKVVEAVDCHSLQELEIAADILLTSYKTRGKVSVMSYDEWANEQADYVLEREGMAETKRPVHCPNCHTRLIYTKDRLEFETKPNPGPPPKRPFAALDDIERAVRSRAK